MAEKEKEKTPEERGKESAEAFMAGVEYAVVDTAKQALHGGGQIVKWGCIGFVTYCVIGAVLCFLLFAAFDLLGVIPPWLIVVAFVLAVVYYATKKPEPPKRT